MHPLPHGVGDTGVHQLKGIAWGPANLSWGIAFQELQSDYFSIHLKLAGIHESCVQCRACSTQAVMWKLCSLVSADYSSDTRKLSGRPDAHLGSMQVIGCCQAGPIPSYPACTVSDRCSIRCVGQDILQRNGSTYWQEREGVRLCSHNEVSYTAPDLCK